jgi:malonyl-CoA O-methyltransferase
MNELTKQQIERQFDRAAQTYDEVAGLQQKMAQRLIEFVESTPSSSNERPISLVDLGCGTGYAIAQLVESHPTWSFAGLDLSNEMLRVAQARIDGTCGVNWKHGDLQETGFDSGSFDWVFSNAAIQWCDAGKAATEIRRILAPNGKFAVSTFVDRTLHQWRSAFSKVAPTDQPRVHHFLSADSVKSAFDNASLSIEQFERDELELNFDNVDEMFASIKKLGATNATSTRAKGMLGRQKYRAIREHFEEELKRSGSLTLTFDCVFLSGSR